MIIEWHTHIYPPEAAAADTLTWDGKSGPTWEGRCPMTLENVLAAHQRCNIDVTDADLVQTFYAAPHRWTSYASSVGGRRIIQTDLAKWDYRHQVLETTRVPPWRVFAWLKAIELVNQLRPRALLHRFSRKDRRTRAVMRWYYRVGRAVFVHELWSFLFRDRRDRFGPTLQRFWGPPLDETAMARQPRFAGAKNKGKLADRIPNPPDRVRA
jgi:hypothetical protein